MAATLQNTQNILQNLQHLHTQQKLANVYLILPPSNAGEKSMTLWRRQLVEHIYSWETGQQHSGEHGHPDLLLMQPAEGRVNYVVQDFENYFREINYGPGQWRYRYILIESADRIPTLVANKLLMSLEFSPLWCIHFLLCDSTRPLLPTIESRAVKISLSHDDLRGANAEDGQPVIKLSQQLQEKPQEKLQDLQELLKDVQKNAEVARRWEYNLLALILEHPQFDQGDSASLLCKILSRNVTSVAFKNPAYERIVPLWHLLKNLDNQN